MLGDCLICREKRARCIGALFMQADELKPDPLPHQEHLPAAACIAPTSSTLSAMANLSCSPGTPRDRLGRLPDPRSRLISIAAPASHLDAAQSSTNKRHSSRIRDVDLEIAPHHRVLTALYRHPCDRQLELIKWAVSAAVIIAFLLVYVHLPTDLHSSYISPRLLFEAKVPAWGISISGWL